MSRPLINEATLGTLSELAGLELSAERRQLLAPALNDVIQQLAAFDTVDIGEMPPAHSYDPRWGEKS